jgi:hypothetical protein
MNSAVPAGIVCPLWHSFSGSAMIDAQNGFVRMHNAGLLQAEAEFFQKAA